MSAPVPRDDDLVSIIIPHRDQRRWLAACLDSCVAQTHPALEVIVVDDASAEDVAPLVARAKGRARRGQEIRLHRLEERSGPGRARNAGLSLAQGAYVQFLDADDYIAPAKIERQLAALKQDGAEAVLSRWRYVISVGPFTFPAPKEPRLETSELLLETIVDGERWFPVMACLFAKPLVDRVGPWSETDTNEDREYRYRILREGARWTQTSTDACYFFYRRYLEPSRLTAVDLSPDEAEARRRSDLAHLELVRADLAAGRLDAEIGRRGLEGYLRLLPHKLAEGASATPTPGRGPAHTWLKGQFRRVTSDELRFRLTRARGLVKFLRKRWQAARGGPAPGSRH